MPDCCPSSSHLVVWDVWLVHRRVTGTLSTGKTGPDTGSTRRRKTGTFDIRGWGCICELEVDAGVPTGEDLLLRVERVVFFFLPA